MNALVQYACVSGGHDVPARGQRQPEVIIGATCAHAATRGGMPPMLDVPFAKLMSGAEEQMFAHETRRGIYERHHILQLIAKTERTSRLIVAAARPETAREGLVQQPTVCQNIDRRIGCLHIHCAEGLIPI